MKFNKNAEPVESSDLYYDLFNGGYIKPEKLLSDEKDVKKVEEAINTIREFLTQLKDVGLLEEM